MAAQDEPITIAVDGQQMAGTLVAPGSAMPGVLFVHGWGGNQDYYLPRAREIAAIGCVCLTFTLRGQAPEDPQHATVTREQSLRDVIAAYDVLAGRPGVDRSAIAVVGTSYGGYLAAILTTLRPVRWLALRAPALYKDADWTLPKQRLDRDELAAYRRMSVRADDNRALRACAAFAGDVLIVESERDDIVPHPAVASYRAAFAKAHSLTHRVITGADHALSAERWQQAYSSLLVTWATEMVLGAREGGAAPQAHTQLRPAPRRRPPRPA